MKKRTVLVLAGAAAVLALGRPASATMPMQKKAKEAGIAAVQNCQSCHVEKLPKKGDPLKTTEMGQWLMDQKASRKAKEVDVLWLKEYKPKAN
jgi:hypothetical protein